MFADVSICRRDRASSHFPHAPPPVVSQNLLREGDVEVVGAAQVTRVELGRALVGTPLVEAVRRGLLPVERLATAAVTHGRRQGRGAKPAFGQVA